MIHLKVKAKGQELEIMLAGGTEEEETSVAAIETVVADRAILGAAGVNEPEKIPAKLKELSRKK